RARSVNRSCERFEAEWRAGGRPQIASYLDSSDPSERSALVRELLALELELRREQGEHPDVGEYVARFPQWQALIAATFAQNETGPSPQGGAVRGPQPGGCPTVGARGTNDAETLPHPPRAGSPETNSPATIGDYEL